MKKILCLSLLVFSLMVKDQANAQSAYYDAKELKSLIDTAGKWKETDKGKIADILSHYCKKSDVTSLFFNNNLFIKDFTENWSDKAGLTGPFNNPLLPSIGNLNVTSIADGLARFLIKRGKEELSVAFFNQFKEFLNKHEECKILFPKTVELLKGIDSYKYATFLENLRNDFHTDLSNLIIHLNQVIDLPKYEMLIANHSEIKLVVGTANIVSELSQSGNSIMPDSVIKQLAVLPWGKVSKNLENSFKFLNIISQSIRADTSQHQSWVQLSELNKNLFTDSLTLRIYFGLLYQQASSQNITFYGKNKDSIRIDTLLARQKDHIFRLSGLIENFSLLADDVQNTIEDFKTKKEEGALSNDDYYTYINKSINIIDYGFKLVNTFKIPEALKTDVIHDKYIDVARNANYLYKNIYTKNYNSAVMNICNILDSLLPGDSAKKIIPRVLKYGNFMASVVKAESPEDVQSAIEAAALPTGSSSIKKNSAFNVSLNAYIGGYFGKHVGESDETDGNNSKIGVTAPIGIAFNLGLGHYKNGSPIGALSLFGTIIDIGAIAGYRLNDDSTALDQKVTLNDIFTPGGYLVYGIGVPFKGLSYVPLSIGYGWQYGSKLYNKKDGKLEISDKSRWRSNWFITIDIPLANFWTKNYKK
ncbi:hypothetical protein [Agriterribacter humi]|uniref:hypothetical protein n=1 Tax=Agriterribacter humi TaxID=1104781 RepID=UPI0012656FDF|nr:hypothetical protein [Agriterribacter humi]